MGVDEGCRYQGSHPGLGDAVTGMRYHSAEVSDVDRYIDADAWAMEQKLDGVRCIAHYDGTVRFCSHTGNTLLSGVRHHAALGDELAGVPLSVVLDCELMDSGDLWVFDLLSMAGQSTTDLPFSERRMLLVRLFDSWSPDRIRLVDSFTDADDKRALWERVLSSGAEGVVVKRLKGTYSAKGRSRDVLKIKVTKTIDVVIVGFGHDTVSALLALEKDGFLADIGKCSLLGKPPVELGDVIEVEYLYCVDPKSPRLYQPRMLRKRPDKTPVECGWDQLDGSFTSKEVIAA